MQSIALFYGTLANGNAGYIRVPPKNAYIKRFHMAVAHSSGSWYAILIYDESNSATLATDGSQRWFAQISGYAPTFEFKEQIQCKNLHVYVSNSTGGGIYPMAIIDLVSPQDYIKSHEGM